MGSATEAEAEAAAGTAAAAGARPRLAGAGVMTACFCVCLALGSCFSIGNLTTYVTSFLRRPAGGGGAVHYADTMWLDSALRMTMGPLYMAGGLLYRRLGPRPATALGGALLLLGTSLSSLAVRSSLSWLMVTYSLLQGAGIGVALASVSLTCVAWFPRRCGLALGVNMGGFALGPVVFNWVQTGYVNPGDAAPGAAGYFEQPELLRRVPALFLLQALVQAALLLPALLLLRQPPAAAAPTADAALTPPRPGRRQLRVVEALRTRQFYQLLLGYVPTMVAFEFFSVSWKTFGLTFIGEDRFLATVGTVSPLFALLGNVAWGRLGDATSFRSVLVVANGLMSILFCTLSATPRLGVAGYCGWVWTLAATFPAMFACELPLIKDYFGETNAGVLLGLMNTVRALFTPVTPLLARPLLLRRHGYPILFLVQGAFALVAMCSLISTGPVPGAGRPEDVGGEKDQQQPLQMQLSGDTETTSQIQQEKP